MSTPKKIVDRILDNLYDRDGFGDWWDAIVDEEKAEDIEKELENIVIEVLKEQS